VSEPIGYAVVDLQGSARTAPTSDFAHVTNSRLVAVVASTREHAQALARPFDATPYVAAEYRDCLERRDVDAVYLMPPTALRGDYAVDAARAGVHVLCETPMAVTTEECRRVLRICEKARVKLMVASSVQFHPAHLEARQLAHGGSLGALKTVSADLAIRIDDPTDVRLQRRMGGGSMYDLGAACIACTRTLFAAEPAQVMAMTARRAGRAAGDADDGAVALVRFPDEQFAHFHTSFGEEPASTLLVLGEHGSVRVTPAFASDAPVDVEIVRSGEREMHRHPATPALAPRIQHFSDCIRQDRPPEPGGIDGLQDVRTIEAIYRSAREGRPVTLPLVTRSDPGSPAPTPLPD
jgi:glucose-fructose oxidoreductase